MAPSSPLPPPCGRRPQATIISRCHRSRPAVSRHVSVPSRPGLYPPASGQSSIPRLACRCAGPPELQGEAKQKRWWVTHVVFFLHVHLARRPPHAQLLVLCQFPHLAVLALVPDCRGPRQHKGPGHDDGQKRQPKAEKWPLADKGAVPHAELAAVARRPKPFALKRRHRLHDWTTTSRRSVLVLVAAPGRSPRVC